MPGLERDTPHPLTSPQISHSAGRIAAACLLDPNDWLGAKDIIRLPRAESLEVTSLAWGRLSSVLLFWTSQTTLRSTMFCRGDLGQNRSFFSFFHFKNIIRLRRAQLLGVVLLKYGRSPCYYFWGGSGGGGGGSANQSTECSQHIFWRWSRTQ